MPSTPNTTVRHPNVFYSWYNELCQRSSIVGIMHPKSKCGTVFELAADRLKFAEWSPVINALRQDTSLHRIKIWNDKPGNYTFHFDITKELAARSLKQKYGVIFTDYLFKSLIRALSNCVRCNTVLYTLELEGLPMFPDYLKILVEALKYNKSITYLSLAHCPLKNEGCEIICRLLQEMPNVQHLDLTNCELESESGKYIAKLISYQQLNRYSKSWHNSLRYEDPESGPILGIRRITLNCNYRFGNDGLDFILNTLEDELWLKALDMQRCGINDNIGRKLLDILGYNHSLEVADFRQNELSFQTFEKILALLNQRGVSNEFPWCNTIISSRSTFVDDLTTLQTSATLITRKESSTRTNTPTKDSPRNTPYTNKRYIESNKKKIVQINMQLKNILTPSPKTPSITPTPTRVQLKPKSKFGMQNPRQNLISAIENAKAKPAKISPTPKKMKGNCDLARGDNNCRVLLPKNGIVKRNGLPKLIIKNNFMKSGIVTTNGFMPGVFYEGNYVMKDFFQDGSQKNQSALLPANFKDQGFISQTFINNADDPRRTQSKMVVVTHIHEVKEQTSQNSVMRRSDMVIAQLIRQGRESGKWKDETPEEREAREIYNHLTNVCEEARKIEEEAQDDLSLRSDSQIELWEHMEELKRETKKNPTRKKTNTRLTSKTSKLSRRNKIK